MGARSGCSNLSFFIDFFVGGEFLTYGLQTMKQHYMEPHERSDPMSIVFPKMTKCTFHKYGSSGSLESIDGLCVLPLNVANEKIFIFLFFYLGSIALITSFHLIYRVACLMPFVRINHILAKVWNIITFSTNVALPKSLYRGPNTPSHTKLKPYLNQPV